jgi:hypothetical protein
MKLWRILRLAPLAIALLALVIVGSTMPGCGTDEVPVGSPDGGIDFESFYGVGPELKAELEQIVLADPRVQELLQGKDYSFTVDGHTIESQDFNLAVGVRLKDETTPEEFREWVHGGRQDSSLIEEYVGVLNIGYNDKYYFTINREEGQLVEILYEEGQGGIPEVTAEEKQRAVEIALADATVQQLLAGKEYEIAPDGKIGVWHTGDIKLGVAFEIDFARTYSIDMDLPRYQGASHHVSGEVEGVIIDVLLEENRVATIIPKSPITED